jgi:uncharacterized protein (DUF169 family)
MTDFGAMERQLAESLRLEHRPVAIAFRHAPPAGVSKFTGQEPSGCSFWRLAAGGRTFYTVAGDHFNCPIGSYTHNLPLPSERSHELEQVLGMMTSVGYIRMEEIPGIHRLPKTPEAVVYAPLGDTPVEPDVVLFWGRPAAMMLLQETALRAGVTTHVPVTARPTCMALPAVIGGGLAASTGCIGNRVYTGIDDGELYVAVAGTDLEGVVAQAKTIAAANLALRDYHTGRRAALATE